MSDHVIRHAEYLGVAKLGPGADFPRWAVGATLVSVTATATQTSVICAYGEIPRKAKPQGPYVAFEFSREAEDAPTLVALQQVLGEHAIAGFSVETFDSSWLLVPQPKAEVAVEAWRRTGVAVSDAQYDQNPESD